MSRTAKQSPQIKSTLKTQGIQTDRNSLPDSDAGFYSDGEKAMVEDSGLPKE